MAAKLHRALDSYKVPKALQGMPGRRGPVPESLHPIFRDREDLAGGGELGDRLRAALESSDALIVLCTPAAAKSHWVDEEVRLFREKRGNDSIFPVIGAGDPESDDPEVQCMPPSLRDNTVLAADLRDIRKDTGHIIGDGPEGGRQKLLAGLLGLDLDHLRRREDARRRRQMLAMAAALVLFVGLGIAATVLGIAASRNAAEAQRLQVLAESNAERARRGETLARERAAAEAIARKRESAARAEAEKQHKRAQQQHALALANAAEARRQTGLARANATRAEAQFARAQDALADSFALRGKDAATAGDTQLALRYALAGGQISSASRPAQQVLLARLISAPQKRRELRLDTDSISFITVSPDGTRLMTSGLDKVARLFDTETGEQIEMSEGGPASKGRTANARGMNADPRFGGTKLTNNWFSPDSQRLLLTLEDGRFQLRDARDGHRISTYSAHSGPVPAGSFNPDGKRVLTGSFDGTARVWDLAEGGERLAELRVPMLRSSAWGPDGESIVTMSVETGLQVWRGGRETARLPNRETNAAALAITADGEHAIEIDNAGVVRISRLRDGAVQVRLSSSDVVSGAFAISADSRFVALGRSNGHVVVWDMASRSKLADFAAHGEPISTLGLTADNRMLASATNTGELALWNLMPLFESFDQLSAAACRQLEGQSRFTADERAADPLIDAVWGDRSVCQGR
jgi:hypothetical protein